MNDSFILALAACLCSFLLGMLWPVAFGNADDKE